MLQCLLKASESNENNISGEAIVVLTVPELNILLKCHGIETKEKTQDKKINGKNKTTPIFKVWTELNEASRFCLKFGILIIKETALGQKKDKYKEDMQAMITAMSGSD